MTKIFLSAKDDFASLVPDYWKPCVPAGLAGKNQNCQFASDMLAIPGVGFLGHDASGTATAVLGLTVNQDGIPTNIYVLNPLTCGLDAQAVAAVAGWRFQPAEKDGQPVAIEIAVEVDFHLY